MGTCLDYACLFIWTITKFAIQGVRNTVYQERKKHCTITIASKYVGEFILCTHCEHSPHSSHGFVKKRRKKRKHKSRLILTWRVRYHHSYSNPEYHSNWNENYTENSTSHNQTFLMHFCVVCREGE